MTVSKSYLDPTRQWDISLKIPVMRYGRYPASCQLISARNMKYGPDEFVAELYALNRILSPTDTSLDRDMIEVMMEQRQQDLPVKEKSSDAKMNISSVSLRQRTSPSKNKENDEDWMNLPDRI